jgi:hypothetical protein
VLQVFAGARSVESGCLNASAARASSTSSATTDASTGPSPVGSKHCGNAQPPCACSTSAAPASFAACLPGDRSAATAARCTANPPGMACGEPPDSEAAPSAAGASVATGI